ncbi:MAG: hypothetical protein JWO86_4330 [Myxococcaceae bacterium]|nr:hypothetical protein [Myxococcaceae bacterium]
MDEEQDALELEALGPRTNLRTRAEEVSFDARQRTLELIGNVRIDSPPFHLTSQRIRLTRMRYGIEVDGKGSLAFCPCLGTPLKVDFDQALVAPPGDLILKNPTLRFYDVPILPLPYFWLRSEEKLGLLPPDLAYRGQDGVYVGGGVHVPWKSHGEKVTLDLRGGAYVLDGFVVDARLRTVSSTTKIRYDRLPGGAGTTGGAGGAGSTSDDGLLVDARGATSSGELGVSWDADLLRGTRGVASTTELDAAARRWDRATAEGALRGGPFVVSVAMRAVTRRGGNLTDVDAAGPVTSVRASGAAGSAVTYDATIEGGSLRTSDGTISRDALSFARAEAGARAVGTLSALEASIAVRGAADVANGAVHDGTDRAGSVRARVGAPLAKRFGGGSSTTEDADEERGRSPWVHVIDPYAEAAVLHAHGDDLLGMSAARSASGIDGTATLLDAGFTTTLGRWSSNEAFEVGGVAGAAFGARGEPTRALPLARGRVAASLVWLGASGDVATVLGGNSDAATSSGTSNGFAAVGRTRLGRADGLRVLANVAARTGIDPVLARALVDAPLEPASGFLVQQGTTGGAGLVVPWAHAVTTSIGADGDATRRELVAARAGVELRDRCGCLTLRVMGAHRLGRDGVDVWLALDFAANR